MNTDRHAWSRPFLTGLLHAALILLVGGVWYFRFSNNSDEESVHGFCEKNEVTPYYTTDLNYFDRKRYFENDPDICFAHCVGGLDALPAEFPYQVHFGGAKVKCGGTVLNEHFILTAAHCFIGKDGTLKPEAYRWSIVGGDTHLNLTEETEQERSISIIHPHPGYKRGIINDDIALVKLKSPFVLNKFLKAPLLPSKDFVLKFNWLSALTVSGYGDLSYQGMRPTQLQKTYPSNYSNCECQAAYSTSETETVKITKKIICAGGKGRDSCQGDSGGPLIFSRCGTDNFEDVLVGVVLGGFECGREDYPGLYTAVSEYMEWIQTSLRNTSIWGLTQGDCAKGGCCQNGGSCFVATNSNSYSCLCPDGFKGLNCENVDECGPSEYRKNCVCSMGRVKDPNDATRCVASQHLREF